MSVSGLYMYGSTVVSIADYMIMECVCKSYEPLGILYELNIVLLKEISGFISALPSTCIQKEHVCVDACVYVCECICVYGQGRNKVVISLL